MRWPFRLSLWAAVVALFGGCSTTPLPPTEAPLTEPRLPVPVIATERAYLGLSDSASNFKLAEIRCELLVVDCFDMYCHICQSDAKRVNRLYDLVQTHGLGERIKFIGLGVGDTPLEVATFREKFAVPFPLFPDRHAVVAKSLGPLRMPNLIALRKTQGRLTAAYSHAGDLHNPEEFLSQLQAILTGTVPQAGRVRAESTGATCSANSSACRHPAEQEPEGGVSGKNAMGE